MIIGISGKVGSGKDTVGNIINYLTSSADNLTFNEYLNYKGDNNKFLIKKFADKLKDILCIITGYTREQLEDREFKERVLGEEWNCWVVKTYWTNDKYQYYTLDNIFVTQEEANDFYKECGSSNYCDKPYLRKMTLRDLIQLLGTECGRDIIHPNIWVNSLFNDYKYKEEYPNWIITDVRMANELDAIINRKGITIRVNREFNLSYPKEYKEFINSSYNNLNQFLREKLPNIYRKRNHYSEIALDNAKFDYVINNNGSIDELIINVQEILMKENIKYE